MFLKDRKGRSGALNKEIHFIKNDIVKISESVIREMKHKAAQNHSGKIRYCLHESEEASMQEMLFVVPDFGYARPHMHKEVAESHVIIDGEGYCLLFTSDGDIMECFKVSRNDNFIYRIQKGIFHMVMPVAKQIVIYEVREGRFDNSTNIFPEWAPRENEEYQVKQYKNNLLKWIQGRGI